MTSKVNNNDLFYSQISRLNEIIIRRFGSKFRKHSVYSKLLSGYFLMLHTNFNSSNSDYYDFKIKNTEDKTGNFLDLQKKKSR